VGSAVRKECDKIYVPESGVKNKFVAARKETVEVRIGL